jgi:hypothetical protein
VAYNLAIFITTRVWPEIVATGGSRERFDAWYRFVAWMTPQTDAE